METYRARIKARKAFELYEKEKPDAKTRAVGRQWPPTARQHGTERQYRRPPKAIFNGPQARKYSVATRTA